MAKCSFCSNENANENIYCGRCGRWLGQSSKLELETDFPTIAFDMSQGTTTKKPPAHAGGQHRILPKNKKPNFKSFLITVGLLLLYAVGFGIANSALLLTLGARQYNHTTAGVGQNTMDNQPIQETVREGPAVTEAVTPVDSEIANKAGDKEVGQTEALPKGKRGKLRKK